MVEQNDLKKIQEDLESVKQKALETITTVSAMQDYLSAQVPESVNADEGSPPEPIPAEEPQPESIPAEE